MKSTSKKTLIPKFAYILLTTLLLITSCSYEDFLDLKKKHPNKILICYVDDNQHCRLMTIRKSKWDTYKTSGSIRLDDHDDDGFVPNNPCGFGNMGDCDDTNPNVNPASEEICDNTIDDNCDGHIDAMDSACAGPIDSDGDGINDEDDACPNSAGLDAFNGCPDTDADGVEDSKDDCPNEAGLGELNGCPDSDGDGVPDKDDNCPTVAGLKSLSGCPDADGDGIADKDDVCPNEAGPAANSGCPWPDTDGDGVLDRDDDCPNQAGTVANNGCPETTP